MEDKAEQERDWTRLNAWGSPTENWSETGRQEEDGMEVQFPFHFLPRRCDLWHLHLTVSSIATTLMRTAPSGCNLDILGRIISFYLIEMASSDRLVISITSNFHHYGHGKEKMPSVTIFTDYVADFSVDQPNLHTKIVKSIKKSKIYALEFTKLLRLLIYSRIIPLFKYPYTYFLGPLLLPPVILIVVSYIFE